jgi:hypothetical protein
VHTESRRMASGSAAVLAVAAALALTGCSGHLSVSQQVHPSVVRAPLTGTAPAGYARRPITVLRVQVMGDPVRARTLKLELGDCQLGHGAYAVDVATTATRVYIRVTGLVRTSGGALTCADGTAVSLPAALGSREVIDEYTGQPIHVDHFPVPAQ